MTQKLKDIKETLQKTEVTQRKQINQKQTNC